MGKNTSFTLGDHFATFVEDKVREGRYANASDVLRAGLRLLEDQELRFSALRTALIEGEASGPPVEFDIEAFVSAKRETPSGTG